MKDPRLRERLLERLDIIGLLAFTITVLFITFPCLLFSQNAEEIPRAVVYYRYFFAAALGILLLLASIFLFLPRRVGLVTASLFSAYALLVVIFDLVRPLDIGPIVEGTESVAAAPVAGAIQIVLIIGTVFVVFYIPRKVRSVIAWGLAAVFLVSGLPFMFAASSAQHIPAQPTHANNDSAPDFNIYHIVFDHYYGPWLEWSLGELSRNSSELAGFTHYRRNVSNYDATTASFASLMSGITFLPGQTVVEWYGDAERSSIIDDLRERGFSTYYYGLILRPGTTQVQKAYTNDRGGGVFDIRLAIDYWLLRVAPVALRHTVLDDHGTGPVTRSAARTNEVPTGDIRTPRILSPVREAAFR